MFVADIFFFSSITPGGSSMYPGLPTRLEKDIKDRYLNEILKGEWLVLFGTVTCVYYLVESRT